MPDNILSENEIPVSYIFNETRSIKSEYRAEEYGAAGPIYGCSSFPVRREKYRDKLGIARGQVRLKMDGRMAPVDRVANEMGRVNGIANRKSDQAHNRNILCKRVVLEYHAHSSSSSRDAR